MDNRRASLKRSFDIIVAGGTLIVLSPILAVVVLLIALRMGFPVLFRQTRPGYKGEPFEVIKFRTMRGAFDAAGRPLTDSERLTPLGRTLRRTSLDEIPQLWNVLRGDMSLIGPRPLLMEYLERYTPEQMRRHDAKPGITGLAQVSGRNNVPWEEKFKLDVWYVDHWSLWLDLKILIKTVLKVLKAEGVSAKGMATMSHFTGSKK